MQKQIRLTGWVMATTFMALITAGSLAAASAPREKGGAPWRPILVSTPPQAGSEPVDAPAIPTKRATVRIAERPQAKAGVRPAAAERKKVKRRTSSIPRRSMVSSKR